MGQFLSYMTLFNNMYGAIRNVGADCIIQNMNIHIIQNRVTSSWPADLPVLLKLLDSYLRGH